VGVSEHFFDIESDAISLVCAPLVDPGPDYVLGVELMRWIEEASRDGAKKGPDWEYEDARISLSAVLEHHVMPGGLMTVGGRFVPMDGEELTSPLVWSRCRHGWVSKDVDADRAGFGNYLFNRLLTEEWFGGWRCASTRNPPLLGVGLWSLAGPSPGRVVDAFVILLDLEREQLRVNSADLLKKIRAIRQNLPKQFRDNCPDAVALLPLVRPEAHSKTPGRSSPKIRDATTRWFERIEETEQAFMRAYRSATKT